jgi:hypothetical protein
MKYNRENPDDQINEITGKNRTKLRSITLDIDLNDRGPRRRTHIGEMKDQGPPHSTNIYEMEDQGPPLSTNISKMRDDIPDTEGLKTSGLSAEEIATTDTKKTTTANINNHFDRLVYEANDLSYDDKTNKYEFIKTKLTSRYEKLLDKYQGYIQNNKFVGLPPEAFKELQTTYKNIEEIDNVIIQHKFRSPVKSNLIV